MEHQFTLDNIEETAQIILEKLTHKVVFFYAEMGCGKTTLIKALSKELGVPNITSSPTFSLVNEYRSETSGDTIYHFDLYRLKTTEEAYDMGIEEYLDSGHWCLIEWPEKIESLTEDRSVISIEVLKDGTRKLNLQN